MDDENGAWLTYQEAGDRLGVSPEAARAKAARRRWRRQIGNDGLARVRIPEDERAAGDRQVTTRSCEAGDRALIARSSPARKPVDQALVTALESHIKSLQGENEALREQFAAAEARAGKQAAEFAARDAERLAMLAAEQAKTAHGIAALEDHNATLKADVERLDADLAHERERADKAIGAFAALAERLDALAAARARPWWRRLAG